MQVVMRRAKEIFCGDPDVGRDVELTRVAPQADITDWDQRGER